MLLANQIGWIGEDEGDEEVSGGRLPQTCRPQEHHQRRTVEYQSHRNDHRHQAELSDSSNRVGSFIVVATVVEWRHISLTSRA